VLRRVIGESARLTALGIALGVPGALLVSPGHPEKSLVLLRMKALDEHRMPPLASHVVDQASVDVLTSWIGSLSSCP